MWPTRVNQLILRLGIKFPIIQAPMASITTPELVAAVSNGGALGSLGANFLSTSQMRTSIREIKKLTSAPYGVNLFIRNKTNVDEEKIKKMKKKYYKNINKNLI